MSREHLTPAVTAAMAAAPLAAWEAAIGAVVVQRATLCDVAVAVAEVATAVVTERGVRPRRRGGVVV